jgi:hypothetical protein
MSANGLFIGTLTHNVRPQLGRIGFGVLGGELCGLVDRGADFVEVSK